MNFILFKQSKFISRIPQCPFKSVQVRIKMLQLLDVKGDEKREKKFFFILM